MLQTGVKLRVLLYSWQLRVQKRETKCARIRGANKRGDPIAGDAPYVLPHWGKRQHQGQAADHGQRVCACSACSVCRRGRRGDAGRSAQHH